MGPRPTAQGGGQGCPEAGPGEGVWAGRGHSGRDGHLQGLFHGHRAEKGNIVCSVELMGKRGPQERDFGWYNKGLPITRRDSLRNGQAALPGREQSPTPNSDSAERPCCLGTLA